MTYKLHDKIKLIKDHDNKVRRNPVYGYITAIQDCSKVPNGCFVETGCVQTGLAYLVQTSWSSGMLWWSADALKAAGGKHELAAWRHNWAKYCADHP